MHQRSTPVSTRRNAAVAAIDDAIPRFRVPAAVLAVMLLPALAPGATAQERVFAPEDIISWEAHSFEGETRYEVVEKDGRSAVHAVCDNATASGLFMREEIDLDATPILEWTWRVDETFSRIDETRRSGDDYAARVYAVREHTIARWRTRALNYVWASEQAKGADWPNAYASQAHMIALRSGADPDGGQWHTERRDLREDFATYHDRDLSTINAIAIMTDCDDVGEPVEAWYGGVRLLPE